MKVQATMQTGTEEKWEKDRERGGEGGYAGPTELASMETLPVSTPQTDFFTGLLSASPSFWAFDGQGHGSPGLPRSLQLSGPACNPAGVGTVTVAKCANLCHCPWARGSHGD